MSDRYPMVKIYLRKLTRYLRKDAYYSVASSNSQKQVVTRPQVYTFLLSTLKNCLGSRKVVPVCLHHGLCSVPPSYSNAVYGKWEPTTY